MYHAICLSNSYSSTYNLSSREACEEHIRKHLCKICTEELKSGSMAILDLNGKIIDHRPIGSLMDTGCGAEWIIVDATEYDDWLKHKEGDVSPLDFLFEKSE